MGLNATEKVIQNIKLIKIMKSCGKTDAEIADALGIDVRKFVDVVNEDSYLKDVYEHATDKVASDVEQKFVEQMEKKLEAGKTEDAKWYLERTTKKFQPSNKTELNVEGIDEIIRKNNP